MADKVQIRHSIVVTHSKYGAACDGVTDDHAAIQQALTDGAGVIPVVVPGDSVISEALLNPLLTPLICEGTLIFTGSGEHAVVFGEADGNAHQPLTAQSSLVRVSRDSTDWTDAFAGVCLDNCFGLTLEVYAENFECGLLLRGTGTGCAYNEITLRRIWNNRVGVRLNPTSTAGSYVNQNTFYSGRISVPSNTDWPDPVIGVNFHNDNASNAINGNTFYNPSMELRNATGYTSMFHGSGSATNIAQNIDMFGGRFESTDYVLSGKGIRRSSFRLTRGFPNASNPKELINGDSDVDAIVLQDNMICGNSTDFSQKHELFVVGGWGRRNVVIDSDDGHVTAPARGGYLVGTTDVAHLRRPGTLQTDYITVPSPQHILGMRFDLSGETQRHMRRILMRTHSFAGGGRVAVACYDSSAQKLTGDVGVCNLTWVEQRQLHRTGADMGTFDLTEIFFGPDVATAWVGVAGGTNDATPMRVEYLIPVGSQIRLLPGVSGLDTDDAVCDEEPAVPGTGDSEPVGKFVRNLSVTTGQPPGWWWDGTAWLPGANL